MKLISSAIVGSGISAFISGIANLNSKVLISNNNKVIKNHKFYEFDAIGGNTNIWGAYVNLYRLKKLKNKNKKFKFFIENNNFFEIKKLTDNNKFKNVGFISFKNTNIPFRIKKNFFKKNILFELDNIRINKNNIILSSNKGRKLYCKKVILCIGNINLLKVLLKSNLIKKRDTISFEDGKISYGIFGFFHNTKKYLIPMTISQILKKIFILPYNYDKNEKYRLPILQVSNLNYIRYSFEVEKLLNADEKLIRGFNSNHITNVRINNIPIQKLIQSRSKRISIFCSGTINKYIPGSISQDLIYNAFNR